MWFGQRIAALGLSMLLFGCPGSRPQSGVVPETVPVGKDAFAAGVAGVAALTYVAAGGCKIADCPADTVCNAETERCERIACSSTSALAETCPNGSSCNASTGTCVPF